MIPDTLTRAHVLQALKEIDSTTVPDQRQSMDYDVLFEGAHYPPKYVISVAAKHASGTELPPDQFNSIETNLFLTKLGFEVVGRPEHVGGAGAVTVDNVRTVFERLLPDASLRMFVANVFATTIEQAHAAGAGRWQITFQNGLIRLNGGRVLVFDTRAHDCFIAVDPALLDEPTRTQLEAVGERTDSYVPLPQFLLYRVSHADLMALWSAVEPAFRRFVGEAALTARRCVWSRYHTPAVVEYLADVVGRPLSQPEYGPGSEAAEENERSVYWVNQGKTFDDELAGGYLYAGKKDLAGNAPAHWKRLQELVPGDVVVHYVAGFIRALSRVRESAVDAPSPSGNGDVGRRINVEYWPLPTPLEVETVFGSESARLAAHVDSDGRPFDKNGKVKQGYLWEFTEEGLGAVRAASNGNESWPAWSRVARARCWMFHANPELYDVRAAVKALPDLPWTVRQHKAEIRVGDRVFLWEAGPRGGVVALARVLTEPAVVEDDGVDAPYCKPGLDSDGTEPVVRLAIEHALDPIIEADDMRADPMLVALPAFSSPQRTNSAMSPAQGLLLERWATGKRPPKIVKVAPGDKGELWNECLAGGYVCIGWDETGDARQYTTWSAFRKAFGAGCELGKSKGHVTLKAQELWAFSRLRPGDRVVANRGIAYVLGVGTVKEPGYQWDDSRTTFKHIVRVDWDTSAAGDIPPHKHWGMTTVDKVPQNVVALVLPELAEAAVFDDVPPNGAPHAGTNGAGASRAKANAKPPPSIPLPASPFASLLRTLQSKESRLWFSEEIVAHYILALQAKRFVILTGVSGTGKTQLALAVARHFQPRTKRIKQVAPPTDAIMKRVSPYMHKGRSVILPIPIGAALRLNDIQGTGSGLIEVEYPGGTMDLSCYREVRSTASSVYHLSLRAEIAEWMKSQPAGSEIFFEVLDPTANGRDRVRITVPSREEEVVTLKNYEVVAVRPDWTDSRGLLGYYNPLLSRYVTTPLLRLLLQARDELKRAADENRSPSPFFVILDEMNLARVEQYFSDFLSALESGEPIVLHDDVRVETGEVEGDDDEEVAPVPRRVSVPANLFFTGTVNVDETTHMFSPKVLDRAFVIEFNEVDLQGYGMRDLDDEEGCALDLVGWQGFEAFRSVSSDDWDNLAKVDGGDIRTALTRLHEILARDNRHFGYRVANEIGRFITLAARQCADPVQGLNDALDLAIVSKILPKLHGTQQELEDTLVALFELTVGKEKGRPSNHDAWAPKEGQLALKGATEDDATEPHLPRSSLKLWRMVKRLRAQGFTSFIE